MTREEVIEELNAHLIHWKRLLREKICSQEDGKKTINALEMAIKALEQEPKTDTWSIKDVADTLAKHGLIAEQEPCEDAVSRQAVIELCEGWWLGHTKEDDFATEIRELPSVNPQKQKTDILDKIRAELHATAEMHEDGDYYLRDEWIDEYFDKYKVESEDKE